MCRRLLSCLAALPIVTAVGTATAEETDIERARALFDEAGELERRGEWATAQEKLRSAIRIRETPHLRYALGWALENDDKLLEAKTEYETALRLARRAGAGEVGRLSEERLADVDREMPHVELRGAPRTGARVVVDGRATLVQGDTMRVPVNPGSRIVRVERAGMSSSERLLYVVRGAVHVLDVDGALERAPAPRSADQELHGGERGTTTPSRIPLILTVGGAVLALGGGTLVLASTSDAAERDKSMRQWCQATACTGGTTATLPESAEASTFRQEANDATARGNTKQIVGGVLGSVGLLAAAVGTYLLVRGGGEGSRGGLARATAVFAPQQGGAVAGAILRF